MKKLRLLVTGGAGFIGSNLCDLLVKEGHDIVVIDDLSAGKKENLRQIEDQIVFYETKLEEFKIEQIDSLDGVIHLSAQASVPLSISNFKESSISNILGSISVIDFCTKKNIPLVYASSSAIYGELPLGDDFLKETDLLSPYSIDKYAMELYAKNAFLINNLSSVGLRFFNVYGPRQDPSSPYSGVISIFIDRLLSGKPIQVNGGHQTRDFVYIDDVIKCIYSSLKISLKKDINEQINILTGHELSINELVSILSKILNVDPIINYKELERGDPERSGGTIKKMQSTLDLLAKDFTDISIGLDNTIKHISGEAT